jgi:structural toxin protein (hemagglutinin/hemolysin) RtxA
MKLYEIFVHVPDSHVEEVKAAMFAAGAGKIGNYSHCSWQVKGEGQFCPEVGSKPFLGVLGKIEKVIECRVSVACTDDCIREVIAAMRKAHPYEMPAYGIIRLEDF